MSWRWQSAQVFGFGTNNQLRAKREDHSQASKTPSDHEGVRLADRYSGVNTSTDDSRLASSATYLADERSGIEAQVLHADEFLAFMLGDGGPDCHVLGRQVQLISAGQRVVGRERVGEGRNRLV
jgi:hypothetical protein